MALATTMRKRRIPVASVARFDLTGKFVYRMTRSMAAMHVVRASKQSTLIECCDA
jgi:hypothetical protein